MYVKTYFSCKYTKSVVACDNKVFLVFFNNNEIAFILKLKDYIFYKYIYVEFWCSPSYFSSCKKKSEKKKRKDSKSYNSVYSRLFEKVLRIFSFNPSMKNAAVLVLDPESSLGYIKGGLYAKIQKRQS